MHLLERLPDAAKQLIRSSPVAEYATVTKAGVPIDTPITCFPPEDLATIDLATGLSYPAKAERARRNPKVGLLIEGRPGEPVISIAGIASVKDADLQANTDRYIAESALTRPRDEPWDVAHKAVWYWPRLIVSVEPVRIMWWDSHDAMDAPPHRLDADGEVVPHSDPAPPGQISATPQWRQQTWQEMAHQSLGSGMPGHLTLCDDEGFPLPIRVRDVSVTELGFLFDIPAAAPWKPGGPASLSFFGREIYLGHVSRTGSHYLLNVERALPTHPFVADDRKLWQPTPDVRDTFMARLRHEVARRGQSIPVIPEVEPEPTEGARLRQARIRGTI